MIGWRLWKAIHRPAYGHPLYERIVLERSAVSQFTLWFMLAGLMIGAVIIWTQSLLVLLLFSPVLYVLLNATFNGVNWAFNASGMIARARAYDAYDLLCMIPDGTLAVNWMIFTARLYHEHTLYKSRGDMIGTLQLLTLALCALLFGLLAMPTRELFEIISVLIALMLLIYTDYMQSVVTCGLSAMLIGNLTRRISDARLWAVGLFVLIQVGAYLVLLFGTLIVMPQLHRALVTQEIWLPFLFAPVLLVLTYAALREGVITLLWWRVTDLLNGERDQMTRLAQLDRLLL